MGKILLIGFRQQHGKMDMLILEMKEKQGITEELKARDPMAWVGAMNNIRNAAEEILFTEVIYA